MSLEAHPAKAELAVRRVSIRAVAERIPVSAHYLGRVLNGYARPTARIVEGLERVLGRPRDELFHPESLAPTDRYPGDRHLERAA